MNNTKQTFLFFGIIITLLISGCLSLSSSDSKPQATYTSTPVPLPNPSSTTTPTPAQQTTITAIKDYNISVSSEKSKNAGNLTVFIESHISGTKGTITLLCNGSTFNSTYTSEPNPRGYRISVFEINCLPLSKAYINFDNHNVSINIPKEGSTRQYNLTEK